MSRRALGLAALLMVASGWTLAASGDLMEDATCGRSITVVDCTEWSLRYDGPANRRDASVDVLLSPDGATAYHVAVSTGAGTGDDIRATAHDAATGALRWEVLWNDAENGTDTPRDAVLSPEGSRLYVVANAWGNYTTAGEILVLALDTAAGVVAWTSTIGTAGGGEEACCLALSPDGATLAVAGLVQGRATTIGLDAADGAVRWVTTHTFPLRQTTYWDRDQRFQDVAFLGNDRVIVTGASLGSWERSYCFYDTDMLAIAYDAATGAELWNTTYDSRSPDRAFRLATDAAADRVYVAGMLRYGGCNGNPDPRALVLALDGTTGALAWLRSADHVYGYTRFAENFVLSPDGGTLALTVQGSATHDDMLGLRVVAFSTSWGGIRWDGGVGLPVTAQGGTPLLAAYADDGATLLVAGETFIEGRGYELVVAAVDAATGEDLWAYHDDLGGWYELPSNLAVGDAHVVVGATAAVDWAGYTADAWMLAFPAGPDPLP